MIGILILCALVVLISGYLAWQNYTSAKKVNSPVPPIEEALPAFDSKPDWTVAPATPVKIATPPSSGYAPKSSGLGVLGTIEKQEELKPIVSETKPKRGRKPGSKGSTSTVKDSYKKKGAKRGPKPKKDKGNDLLLS
jgi:hypothetical protein